MTNGRLPQAPARERNRTGRRALDWAARPTASEALVDALRVKVTGRVILPQDLAFDTFTASIAGGVFKSAMTPGSRYRSEFADSLTVSGTITFHERRDECPFSAELSLNPTRTLHRALDAARGRPLSSLPPLTFFTASETLAAGSSAFEVSPNPEPTLDGKDNILPTVGHMGGTVPGSRDAFQAEYLHLFEANLRALLLDAMTPLWMPAATVIQPCRVQREDGVIIELDWHKVTVEHAEIYWERDTPDAPSVVRRMMDAGLSLARSIRATAYSGEGTHYEANQDSPGFPSLTIPLTGKRAVLLTVYAKTRRRVRIEVRYMKDLNVVVRACRSPTSRMTLVLERLKANAARRLPWPQLGRIAALSPDVGISSIADLVLHVLSAAKGNEVALEGVMRSLLLTGGVFADDERIAGSEAIIRRLEKAGVVERATFQLKESLTGRRFGLAQPFATTRSKMLLGFAPVAEGTVTDEPHSADRIGATNPATNRIVRTARTR